METIKTLKKGAIIKGIDFSSSFYERLTSLIMYVATQEASSEQQFNIETLAILMATIDEAAEAQGLTEESKIEDSGI